MGCKDSLINHISPKKLHGLEDKISNQNYQKIEPADYYISIKIIGNPFIKNNEYNALDQLLKKTVEVQLDKEFQEDDECKGDDDYKCLNENYFQISTKFGKIVELKIIDYNIGNSLEQIGKLANLKYLLLINGEIRDINPLNSLKNLEVLCLNNNQIRDINPLNSLKNLQKLTLRMNQISEIKNLKNLSKLKLLDLGCNSISKINGLKELYELRILDLMKNEITEIKGLNHLLKLEELYLGINPLNPIDLQNTKEFDNLRQLKYLNLLMHDAAEIKSQNDIKKMIGNYAI